MIKRRMVSESLGNSGPQQRSGAPTHELSREEVATAACHDVPGILSLMHKKVASGLSIDEERSLGGLLDSLYEQLEFVDALHGHDFRVPVFEDRGSNRVVDWR